MFRFSRSKALIFTLLFSCALNAAFSFNYYAKSAEVVELERLYRKAGRLFTVSSYPVAGSALISAAKAIESHAFGVRDSRLLAELIEKLGAAEQEPRLGVRVEGNYLYRALANPQRAETGEAHSTASGIDFQRFFMSRPSLGVLDLWGQSEQGFFISVRGELMEQYNGELFETDNIPILGGVGSEVSFENHLVTRGNLLWSHDRTTLAFGRDTMRLGPRRGSSLYPNDNLPYMDALRVTLPFGRLSMDYYIASLHPVEASGNDVYPNATSADATNATGPYGFEDDENPTNIWYTAHRFELAGDRISAAIGGQVIVARRNNHLQLTDFVPLIAWHNADVRPNNMSIVLQLRALPINGLELSFDAGYDDINATAVAGIGDYSVPTIDAYIGRACYDIDLPWGSLNLFAEAGTTHYLWGNFDASATGIESQYVDTLARAIYRYRIDGNWGSALLPLTSPYGPGVRWLTLEAGTTIGKLELRCNYLLQSINTLANLIDTSYRESSTVENAPRVIYHDIGIAATYSWAPFTLTLAPSLLIRDGTVGFECSLIFSAQYAARFL